jgi:hypothetical protein
MAQETYSIDGTGSVASKLLRIFLASAIADNNGTLNISKRALAELADNCLKHKGFEIVATPTDDNDIDLTVEWYN